MPSRVKPSSWTDCLIAYWLPERGSVVDYLVGTSGESNSPVSIPQEQALGFGCGEVGLNLHAVIA